MILTKYVIKKGESILLTEIEKIGHLKVDVECPVCKKIRNVHYKSILNSGHEICLPCIRKIKQGKPLAVGNVFHYLTVINQSEKAGFSICECKCGNITEVRNYYLRNGHTRSCGCLKSESLKNTRKVSGAEHGMWKGGVSSERNKAMSSGEYKKWRKEIFKKDEHTCQRCGQVGYKLNAHHIANFADNKDLRTDINNGITFCEKCHKEFHHEFGNKNTNKEQVTSFIQGLHKEVI